MTTEQAVYDLVVKYRMAELSGNDREACRLWKAACAIDEVAAVAIEEQKRLGGVWDLPA
jgi:hypothetical protein